MALTRDELAARCVSTSFDQLTMDYDGKKVVYAHSFRDAQGAVLEAFTSELHFSDLQPRLLTPPEEHALLSLGLCHSTYVYLVAAKRAPLLQIRAGYLSPDELAFFRDALAGALAEYYYLADLDLADFRLECCCDPPPPPPPPQQTAEAPAAAAEAAAPAPPAAAATAAAEDVAGAESAPASVPASAPAAAEQPSDAVTAGASQPKEARRSRPRVLVPFGGGKDSTLLMELLSRLGAQVSWVYYGEWVGSWEVYGKFARLAAASPASRVVLAEQHLPDLDRLKKLNLVPHLPFQDYTAYVSFYTFASAFVALQQEYDYICVGNEYSANAINTTHPKYNYPVNHQYEKSFAAERAFHAFLRDHIHSRLYYFSGLQHMTELEIAQRFAAICAAKYLDLIISCNWAMDDDWCGGCEKCAFVFLLFAAFLPVPDIMSKVFGVVVAGCSSDSSSTAGGREDTSSPIVPGSRESLHGVYGMYDSERHVPVFESLMGLVGHKPFECVGTPEECLAAMYLAYERYGSGHHEGAAGGGAGGGDGSSASCCEAAASEPGAAAEAGGLLESQGQRRQDPQDQQRGGERLPLLLRKHQGLITSRGKEEWEKIRESMQRVAEAGRPEVPTLYPGWFKLVSGPGQGASEQ